MKPSGARCPKGTSSVRTPQRSNTGRTSAGTSAPVTSVSRRSGFHRRTEEKATAIAWK